MSKELCRKCDAETGRAGIHEDSLYIAEFGPYCEDCYNELLTEFCIDCTAKIHQFETFAHTFGGVETRPLCTICFAQHQPLLLIPKDHEKAKAVIETINAAGIDFEIRSNEIAVRLKDWKKIKSVVFGIVYNANPEKMKKIIQGDKA